MTHPILYSAPEERYIDHINRCLEKVNIVFPIWKDTTKRVFSIEDDRIDYLLKEMVVFHDLGKLTKRWQENLGTNKKLPSHAPIGAAYLYKKFTRENHPDDLKKSIVFAVAIHHTDSGLLGDNIERPDVQAIIEGIVDNDGKIKWSDETKILDERFFPIELNELTIEDLKNMARGLRVWARSGKLLDQHNKRIQVSLVHHILKLCDVSVAYERKEYQKKDDENYYGGWLMCENIRDYVDNISKTRRYSNLKAELERWIEVLKKEYDPESIFLFGSFVRGKIRDWSDVDIVIIKKTSKRFLDRIKEVIMILKPKVGADILVYTPEEFNELTNNRPFLKKEVLEKGAKIYERGS
jgi:CRISPR-associated endonuclease Cas3-HD